MQESITILKERLNSREFFELLTVYDVMELEHISKHTTSLTVPTHMCKVTVGHEDGVETGVYSFHMPSRCWLRVEDDEW